MAQHSLSISVLQAGIDPVSKQVLHGADTVEVLPSKHPQETFQSSKQCSLPIPVFEVHVNFAVHQQQLNGFCYTLTACEMQGVPRRCLECWAIS